MWLVKSCDYNWRDVISIVSQSEVQKSCWWANKAIIRERHPIPTIDEVIKDVSEGDIFTKSHLKWSYHQIQLMSCSIKTFETYKGMLFERDWCLASPLLRRNISRSFNKCWHIAVERQTLQMTSSSMVLTMVLTELNMTSDWRKYWPEWMKGALTLTRRNVYFIYHIYGLSTTPRKHWSERRERQSGDPRTWITDCIRTIETIDKERRARSFLIPSSRQPLQNWNDS